MYFCMVVMSANDESVGRKRISIWPTAVFHVEKEMTSYAPYGQKVLDHTSSSLKFKDFFFSPINLLSKTFMKERVILNWYFNGMPPLQQVKKNVCISGITAKWFRNHSGSHP